MNKLTEEQFLESVAEHRMTVIRDEGVYRHVRFAKPGTSVMFFDLITWPGCLCYTGDMGTYVFRRMADMFKFFRTSQRSDGLYINLGYWAEKIEAADRSGGVTEYSPEKFRTAVREWLEEDADPELIEAVEEEVLSHADDGEYAARKAADEFQHEGRAVFQDFFEVDLTVYTHRYQWCCCAIAWGIRQYDRGKQRQVEGKHDD